MWSRQTRSRSGNDDKPNHHRLVQGCFRRILPQLGWKSGTHGSHSRSFRESHPVPESTAVTSTALRCNARSFPRYPSRGRCANCKTALSINKSELARILGVSRPTVYDWLDDGEPNADNRSRIRTLLRLLSESLVSSNNPLFPRFVRSRLEPGDQAVIDLLSEETIDEATAKNLIRRAKELG